MQSEDVDFEVPTSLDAALQRLGMLATVTQSRRQYLKELRRNSYVNMVSINTRYVSNVSIGFRVRPLTPHVRYKPYNVRERHRTRSENNDSEKEASQVEPVACISDSEADLVQLKRAKSLESIVAECGSGVDLQNIEVVSDCIQNLRVAE